MELNDIERELIYTALSEKQDRLDHNATEEEYETITALMDKVIDR